MPQTGFANINGAQLYYEIAGDGPPLVLVHAGICDSRMWDDQFPLLAEQYTTLRYDLRGYGQSQPVAGAFAHHDDLRALLDHLDIDSAIFIGCSMGGMTLLNFALEHPAKVKALVLVGAAVGGYESPAEPVRPPDWDHIVAAFEAGDFVPANHYEINKWVVGQGRKPEDVAAIVRDKVYEMNLIALRNEAAELGDAQELEPPAITRLHEITAPTLVIVGDHDQPDMLDIADILADKIANAEKVVMTNTAHVPNMEHPAVFNRHVQDFLSALP